MKYPSLVIASCSLSAAYFSSQDFSSYDLQALTARSNSNGMILPRSYQFQRRAGMGRTGAMKSGAPAGRGAGAPPSSQRRVPARAQSGDSGPGSLPSQRQAKSRNEDVSASIHSKGYGPINAKNFVSSLDGFPQGDKKESLRIKDGYNAKARGMVSGEPVPGQRPSRHPLKGLAEGSAVTGTVDAPKGGSGHIRVKSNGKKEDFHVPGGESMTKSGLSTGSDKAKVLTTVSNGGSTNVASGVNEEALKYTADY